MMETAIEVQGLRKAFKEKTVVDGLDLTVARGEVFALLGPNGAGKTTTINILTTLAAADAGSARVAGWDIRTQAIEVQRRISLTGQAAAVDDALTATENVVMFARLAGLGRAAAKRRAADLITQFDLTDAASRMVRTFSGGMRRRLDLALSFVVTPEVLFLDEPTTGLDTRSRRALWDIIRMLASAGTTVFLTTQYLEEADQLADRIAVLHDGRIAALGTPAELKARVGGDTVELHDDHGDLLREIPTDGTVTDLRRALDLLDEAGEDGVVTLRRPTLDDVFLAVTAPADSTRPIKELA
ncbi:ABC transporter ATP-binding protein [Microbacterium sp. MYb54]|nr:ABC transporter ATP-binding protein [Microbacterium sp. MYb43]PQZ76280.1 ABC transporter ATP-binding protein [Microbacterium sp. MYb40]PRB21391.1 ABC transporter ATP-binding protein [Microbacterium sp. MYb54]PRB29956.1 ABC transporter ATP-binding protein [Microbacterium sp. MYb50]PRB67885.1 ABC transporter ATP-binding protein [Microbacterium sp. MYb24]PRB76252.1 ABC transporter ATP-binding protein [Microbacterium sp. MYb32]